MSRNSAREYTEIKREQHKDFVDGQVEKLRPSMMCRQKVRILIGKGPRVDRIAEKLNILQKEG